MYDKYNFNRYFNSFEHYYELYEGYNLQLWDKYTHNKITKDELNQARFTYPLQVVGVNDETLVNQYKDNYFKVINTKSRLMPYAKELLEYLYPKYNLYIISNGFKELQESKMKASGIDKYFKKIILSSDIEVMKPYPEIFHFALSATQSELKESLMIGDNWNADITGAKNVGMDQMFYNVTHKKDFDFTPTFIVEHLKDVQRYL